MKRLLFYYCLFVTTPSSAQVIRRSVATPWIGLGAYSNNHIDALSFVSNQACLAQIKNTAAAIYGERKYMLSDLAQYIAAVAMSTHSGNFGLHGAYAGSGIYHESQIGIAYARKMGAKADIGVQFNYHSIRAANYGSASAISCEAGTILHITDKLNIGFHLNNPFAGKFGTQEKLPSIYSIGIGYDASQKFFFSAELVKVEDQPVTVNAGFQYKLISQLWLRAGISSANSSTWFSIGLYVQSFRIDITTSYHPLLGVTPGLSLFFNLKGK